jgi:hypothetical protein
LVVKNGSKIFSITSGDAGAGVLHLDQHVVAGGMRGLAIGGALGGGDVAGAHRQRAAIRHRVAGIDRRD